MIAAWRFSAFILLFSICIIAPRVQAVHLASETEIGTYDTIENVNIEGAFDGKEKYEDLPWSWNLGYAYTQTVQPATGFSGAIVEPTNEVSGSVDWDDSPGWLASTEFVWSATPDENLTSSGLNVSVGYEFDFDPEDPPAAENSADEDEPYRPWLSLRLTWGKRGYNEVFTASIPTKPGGKPKPTSGINAIEQSAFLFSMHWSEEETLRWNASIGYDFYNRSVADFSGFLNSDRAIQTGVSSLSNTVGGLPLVVYGFGFSDDVTSKWTLDAGENISVAANDLSFSFVTRATLGRPVGHFFGIAVDLGVGLEYLSSSTSYDTCGIFDLKGKF